MTAKYATTCSACGGAIKPGEPIRSLAGASRAKWGHADCGVPAAADRSGSSAAAGSAAGGSAADPAPSRTDGMPEGATEVWTDGACSGNPGPGGWAWATKDGRQGWGSSPATTNQRMEVQAALEAITALPGPLVVVSDSTYVVNCFRDGWWRGWLSRGWLNSAKKPVANRDLWEPLVDLYRSRGDVTFRWVKGHSGDEMNDVVDLLAVRAGKEQSHS